MRLKSVRVKNFRCVDDSTEFEACPATCFVGKNEAGKTSLLEALYKLNPDVSELGEFDAVHDYPRRRRREYERRAGTEPDDALITKWELDDDEVKLFEETLGHGALKSKVVAVHKGYYKGRRWTVALDEEKVVEHVLDSICANSAYRERYGETGSVAELRSTLEGYSRLSRDSQNVLEYLRKTFPQGSAQKWVESRLEELLPRFAYFSRWHVMAGRISIEDVLRHCRAKELSGSERVFLALLELGGTTAGELGSAESSEELLANLEAASHPITDIMDQISDCWSQDRHLRVSFCLHPKRPQDPSLFNDEWVFETRIRDTRNDMTLNFGERSTGFVWFFSFLVWLSQAKKNYGDNLVLLLDDVGLGLHPKAQRELLRHISEKLEPKSQVLYATHSPFMVDADNLYRLRTVEKLVRSDNGKEEYLGTKVGSQVLSTDLDTVLPLQTALAYEITQALFSGGNTLLVEEPSDLLYLKWFSDRLTERGRTGLDQAWRITPCCDPGRIGVFIGLFGQNGKHVAVLLDSSSAERGNTLNFKDSDLLKKCNVFCVNGYIEGGEAGDIEDLIGRDTYFALVNACYKLSRARRVGRARQPSPRGRVAQEVAEHFETLPPDMPRFDDYAPAKYLTENSKKLMRKLPNLDRALDRFEKLFAHFNSCLHS